jgi:hypothetical protein
VVIHLFFVAQFVAQEKIFRADDHRSGLELVIQYVPFNSIPSLLLYHNVDHFMILKSGQVIRNNKLKIQIKHYDFVLFVSATKNLLICLRVFSCCFDRAKKLIPVFPACHKK